MNETTNNIFTEIGKRLKEARIICNIKQDYIAEKTGLNRSSISNIETGRHQVSLIVLYKICEILELSMSDLLPSYLDSSNDNFKKEMLKKQKENLEKKYKTETEKIEKLIIDIEINSGKTIIINGK